MIDTHKPDEKQTRETVSQPNAANSPAPTTLTPEQILAAADHGIVNFPEFGEPRLVDDSTSLPPLEVEKVMPPDLADWVKDLAAHTQTPPGMAALFSLGVIATSAQGKFLMEIKPGWREPLNMWLLAIAEPGNLKSPVMNYCTAPILEWEAEQNGILRPTMLKQESLQQINADKVKDLEKEAAKATPERLKEILSAVAELKTESADKVCEIKLFTGDATPEQIENLMVQQGGRLSILGAEAAIFDHANGQYSDGKVANINNMLDAFSRSPIRVDRAGRSVNIAAPALTISTATQPEKIQKIGKGKNGSELRGRGFLGRFLYDMSPSPVGKRKFGNFVPLREYDAWRAGIFSLLNLPYERNLITGEGSERILLPNNADGTMELFAEWWDRNETRMGQSGDLNTCKEWASKLGGNCLRVAGLFHLWQHRHQPSMPLFVNRETMALAIAFCDSLTPHALAAFDEMCADTTTKDALIIQCQIELRADDIHAREPFPYIDVWADVLDNARPLAKGAGAKERRKEAFSLLTEKSVVSDEFKYTVGKQTILRRWVNPEALDLLKQKRNRMFGAANSNPSVNDLRTVA